MYPEKISETIYNISIKYLYIKNQYVKQRLYQLHLTLAAELGKQWDVIYIWIECRIYVQYNKIRIRRVGGKRVTVLKGS
jgi:hypothetical protein